MPVKKREPPVKQPSRILRQEQEATITQVSEAEDYAEHMDSILQETKRDTKESYTAAIPRAATELGHLRAVTN